MYATMAQDTQQIIAALTQGGIGVMPTDTVYGIVAAAHDATAVARAEAVKGNRAAKPLIVLITQTAQMIQLCPTLSPTMVARAEQLWARRGEDYAFLTHTVGTLPYARGISIIVPCRDTRSAYLHKESGGIAFRRIVKNAHTPDTNRLYDVITAVGPIIATSANRSGERVVEHSAQARAVFGTACDFYVGGMHVAVQPSLVVRLCDDSTTPLAVVRQ